VSLRETFSILNAFFTREDIPYALIGGYAVAVWGEIRATKDIDLLCHAADIRRINEGLKRAGFKFEHRTGDVDDPVSDVVRIELGDSLVTCVVDVLAGIRGAPAGVLDRCVWIQIEGNSVPVVSAEDLVVLKLLAGSVRDLEDARSILHLHGDRLDIPMLRRLCPPEINSALQTILSSSGR
jgi:predicted nucleotidyltransferase